MSKGGNVIIFVISIVVAVSMLTMAPGGLLQQTDYQPTTGQQDGSGSTVNDTISDLQDTSVDLSNPISALASAYNMFDAMVTLGFSLDTIMINLGVPVWIATPISWVAYALLIYTIIKLLLRTSGP